MSYGAKIEFERLQELIGSRIMAAGKFQNICRDCGWASICHKQWEK